jgi:phage terminase small subunit
MSLNVKQKRFAEEYSVDHNAAQAAIRAGYSANTAKEAGSRLMARVAVKQLVAKLDTEKRRELGIEAATALARLEELWEQASQLQPKIWKGKPVTYRDPATGEVIPITEFRSAAVAAKTLEMMIKLAGLDAASRSTVEHFGEVVYTLHLDRDLSQAPHDESEES